MSFVRPLARMLFGASDGGSTPPPHSDYWYKPVGGYTLSGVQVNDDIAARLSTVFRCVEIITGSLVSTPLFVYRRREDGGKDRWPQHPLYDILHRRPNRWQSASEWKKMGQRHLLYRGNFYNWIRPGARGAVDELWPLNPDAVRPEQQRDKSIIYHVTLNDGTPEVLFDDEVFHIRGLSHDGVTGVGVLDYARESIGIALAQEQFAAKYFSQAPQPSGVLKHPGRLSQTAFDRLRESWDKQTTGAQAHRTAILEEGLEFTQFDVGMTAEASQLIEARVFSVTDIARFFGVPAHMVGETTKNTSWGSGIEELSLGYVTWTLLPWLVLWEERISTDLMLAPRTYFAEFLVDGLLRGNALTRAQAFAIQRNGGALSRDEWRAAENRNVWAGSPDNLLTPVNMQIHNIDGTITPPPGTAQPPAQDGDAGGEEPGDGEDGAGTMAASLRLASALAEPLLASHSNGKGPHHA